MNLVERRELFKNPLSEQMRVGAHVIVDRGQFWHGDSLLANMHKTLRSKEVLRESPDYSARRKIRSRLRAGQRIGPVSVGNRMASLSTPQLSQSRNSSFVPLKITGSHPMPRASITA